MQNKVDTAVNAIIIGIGGAGSQIVDSIRSFPTFNKCHYRTITANWDEEQSQRQTKDAGYEQIILGNRELEIFSFWDEDAIKDALIANPPSALHKINPLLNGSNPLIVVAGIGGSTGTILGLHLAKAATAAKIPVLGVWIQPFDFEGRRVKLSKWIAESGFYSWSAYRLLSNERLFSAQQGARNVLDARPHINKLIAKDILIKRDNYFT